MRVALYYVGASPSNLQVSLSEALSNSADHQPSPDKYHLQHQLTLRRKKNDDSTQSVNQTLVTRTSLNLEYNASRRLFNDFNEVLHSLNLHITR